MASVGAGRGCGGMCPRPLPCQGGGLGVGEVLLVGGRLGRRGGGRPWLHSRGELSSVFGASVGLVLVCAKLDVVGAGELQGVALYSLLACPGRCCLGLAPFGGARPPRSVAPRCPPGRGGGTGLCPHTRSSRSCGRCRRAAGPSRPFRILGTPRAGAVLVAGGRMMRMPAPGWGGGNDGREDDKDAWSGFAGRVRGAAGGREVAAFPAWLGAGAPLFRLARLGGTGGSGAGGAWGLK